MKTPMFLLGIVLSSMFSSAHAADFTPLMTHIAAPQEEAKDSTLGFKVIGHFPQEYALDAKLDESRKLAFLSFIQPEQSGIRVIDLSNPESPNEISTYLTGSLFPRDFVVSDSGKRLYVLTDRDLQIVDTENPKFPKVLGTYDIRGDDFRIVGVSKEGGRLYVYERGQLKILDVKDTGPLKEVGRLKLNGRFQAIYVSPTDQFAYFANDKNLYSLNIRNPRRPRIVASMPLVALGSYGNTGPLTASDDGDLIVIGDFDQFNPAVSNLRLAQLDSKGGLSVLMGGMLNLKSRGGYSIQLRGRNRSLYLMTPEEGLIKISVSERKALVFEGGMRVPMSKQIGTFGRGGFYVSKDEKQVVVPITVRHGEDIATIGGLTIYGRD
ncbi:MAG: hypothetical protein IPH39_01240 [Sulfuritalea sp.]|jgi:hypothetical protein|nr:hypothetical protein [Sulfuritalea sp.]MBK9352132.1 hypothetical protein [Sulfuritalea sp.]